MSRGTKIVLIALAICASASVLMAAAGAVFVYQDGVIDVLVQEKSEDGTTIHLIVPMTLARVALAFVPFESGLDACPDAQRYWPIVEAACSGIARSPDGVFVHVEGPDERVIIEKRGGRLVIDVDDRDAKVHVSVPVRAVEYVVRRMRPSSPGWGPRATITLSDVEPSEPAEPSEPVTARRARAIPRA